MPATRTGRRCLLPLCAACALLPVAAGRAFAMGTESFGNHPVTAQADWPSGAAAAVNLKSRVYSRWVNGNESFFFKGSTKALGEALARFAAIDVASREVVILPRRGGTRTFRGTSVACDWELRVPSGIYLAIAKKEPNGRVLPVLPTLIIYAGSPRVRIEKLEIPPGVELIGVEDLVARYEEGLESRDAHLAAQAAHRLGEHAAAVRRIDPLIASLDDDRDYVRVSAAGALGRFGRRAREALPALERCAADIREGYRETVRAAIEAIEGAEATETTGYLRRLKEIRSFLESRHKKEPGPARRSNRDAPSTKTRS